MKGKDVLKYCAIKKVISLLLIIIMGVAGCLQQITINANEASQQEIIQNVLEDYFCDFLSTLKEDSQKDYSSEDFASINGYIIAKRLVTLRENYKVDFGGICAVEIEEIILDDLFAKDELLEAMVYVKYKYSWGDASEEDTCETGSLYRVTLEASDNTYQVIDLDNTSIEIQMAKNAIDSKTYNTAESYQQIDSFFDKIQQNAKETSETVIDSEVMEEEEQDICTTANNNVSYNATKAKNWGKKLGKHYENYIFKRATWDCTNFVSQCVWAGYGGTEGYTIPTDPTAKDSTCVALKQRVASDYRMTDKWYGRNYDSPYGNPPTEFCGVVNFYDYVTSNSGDGPKATSYNNDKVYTNLSVYMKAGDVLQFYDQDKKRYGHSVIVVSDADYKVSNYTKVRVAQHEDEASNRPLEELIDYFGGESCKMRLLRFKATTF